MYGVPQKKFSLFLEHVTFHNLCLLQGLFVNEIRLLEWEIQKSEAMTLVKTLTDAKEKKIRGKRSCIFLE